MDWEQLFKMQKQLDMYIETTQKVEGKNLFEEKILALYVEIGELANETRCFKFWSLKPKSENAVIAAEYVDGLHFMLSIGLDKNYRYHGKTEYTGENTLTEQFNHVIAACTTFKQVPSEENYQYMFQLFLQLGELLGFDEKAVYQAYLKKNEINYERQDQGY